MKLKDKLIVLGIAVFAVGAYADDTPNFECHNKTIVEYSPGSNWSQLENVLPQHLTYIASQYKSGSLAYAGPITSQSGEPTGALAIYNETDIKTVDSLTKNDPLIVQGVSQYSVKTWVDCILK